MPPQDFSILPYDDALHREQVVDLWRAVFGYDAPHNEPGLVIDKKLAVDDGLFFVALSQGCVLGTVMAGYDGHRGWIYSLAVPPEARGQGLGSALLAHAQEQLAARGCIKVNLQVVEGNETALRFYEARGFCVEARASMGKKLG